MNKAELVAAVAHKTGLTTAQAGKAVDGIQQVVIDALASGSNVSLVGFGAFEVRHRAKREGRNPATGEAITIPASKVAAFKAGKALKDALN